MTRRKPELEKISELGKSPAQKIGGQNTLPPPSKRPLKKESTLQLWLPSLKPAALLQFLIKLLTFGAIWFLIGQISFKGKTLEKHYFDFRSMEKTLKSQ